MGKNLEMCYLIAKDKDKKGCYAFAITHGKYLAEIKRELDAARECEYLQHNGSTGRAECTRTPKAYLVDTEGVPCVGRAVQCVAFMFGDATKKRSMKVY